MTVTNIIKFKQIADKLQLDLKNKNDFEKRLIIQKIFYFLDKLGIDLNIKFNFYNYGPYSHDLTDYYYSTMKLPKNDIETLVNIEITKEEEEILKKIQSIRKKWGADLRKLEFYASVLYIYKDMYIKDRNIEKIKLIIQKLKPNLFDEDEFSQAIKALMAEGLIDKL